jgi:drug/metabolite transporter (DMT)-like permease
MNATLWMLGALCSFCLMAVGARELSNDLAVPQTLFIRGAIGLIIVSVIIISKQQTELFYSNRIKLHIFRNILHFAGQYGWFVAIGLLPLAEVFAIEFTVPVWTAIIATLFLKERMTLKKIFSILLGLVGVFIIINPSYRPLDTGSIIMLASALSFALCHAGSKSLSNSENSITIIFYMCLIQLPISLFFALQHWQWPNVTQWLWLTMIGAVALSAHFCMTKAMRYADVTVIVTLDFLRLPLITIVGVLIYNEQFELSLLFGGALMLLANLVSLYKQPLLSTTTKH